MIDRLDKVIKRFKAFWAREEVDRPIVMSRYLILPPENVEHWDDPEFVFKSFVECYEKRKTLRDDYLPNLIPNLGPGVNGALYGCPIKFSSATSWCEPILDDYNGLDRIEFRLDNKWVIALKDQLDYFRKNAKDKYAVAITDFSGPTDIAAYIRGANKFLYDFYDEPENLHRLAKKSYELWKAFADWELSIAPRYQGGTFGIWNIWQPGNSVYFDGDATVNFSSESYVEYFKRYDKIITEKYDTVFLHFHSAAMHIIQEIVSMPSLDAIEWTSDPNGPKFQEQYDTFNRILESKNLIIECPRDDFKSLLNNVNCNMGVIIFLDGCESIEEANEHLNFLHKI